MKKSYLLIIAAGLFCLAACNKEVEITEIPESPESVKMISETITASLGDDTKVTIANTASDNFAWIAGDNIAVHVSNGDIHKYVLTSDDGASGASASASSASFTVVYPEGYSRDAFAVYPSTIVATTATNYGQSGSALDVSLPSTYTLAQVTGITTPCPMIASNIGSSWEFYHLCGLLRLKVNSIPPSANKITVNFHGNKVHGDFSIASPVTAGESSIVTATGSANDEITITFAAAGVWRDGVDINLPLPTGDYTNITVKAFAGTSELLSVTRPVKVGAASYTINKAAGKKCTASLPVFTVADGKKVIFAPGNLQAVFSEAGTSCTWKFADHQYVSVGNNVANTKVTAGGVSAPGPVDLFGWVGENSAFTGLAQYGIHNSDTVSEYGNTPSENLMHDWGELISDGNTWRTPSEADWECLLNSRSGATLLSYDNNGDGQIVEVEHGRHARGYLMETIHGMYIFPDKYVHPVTKTLAGVNHNNVRFWDQNDFTSEEWEIMEAAGVVFLPRTYYRIGTPSKETDDVLDTSAESAYYWSNTAYDSNANEAYAMYFGSSIWKYNQRIRRWLGCSVRLVRDIN